MNSSISFFIKKISGIRNKQRIVGKRRNLIEQDRNEAKLGCSEQGFGTLKFALC